MSLAVTVDAGGALAGIRAARAATRSLAGAVHRAGAYTQTVVRANASTGTHRPGARHLPGTGPGPNVATGDYRRSIQVTTGDAPGWADAETTTDAVQGPRLEYGFVGRDSRGRMYRQPPYPHWAPAEPVVTEYADQQVERVADDVDRALEG